MERFANRSILLVEDEVLIGMDLNQLLTAQGCTVIGPVGSVVQALRKVAQHKIDGAVLDVKLGQEKIFPVTDVLLEAGIPFVLLTGLSREALPMRYRAGLVVSKPYLNTELVETLAIALVAGPRRRTGAM